MRAPQIVVEVHVASGLPSFSIVGLPDTEIKESRDRIRSAIQNSGFDFPARRITVNLAPADLPKDSSCYDFTHCNGNFCQRLSKTRQNLEEFEFAGELALDGALRPIKGALAISYGISQSKRQLILPAQSAEEAALVEDMHIRAATSLQDVVTHFTTSQELPVITIASIVKPISDFESNNDGFQQVKGQLSTKKH